MGAGFSWLSLIVAFVLALVTRGRWNVPVAAWLGSIFLLHFTRSHGAALGFVASMAVLAAALSVGMQGQIPMPMPWLEGRQSQ